MEGVQRMSFDLYRDLVRIPEDPPAPDEEGGLNLSENFRVLVDELLDKFRVGWVRISDVTPQNVGDTVSSKAFQDSPNDTILQLATSSSLDVNILVESCFPLVSVDGNNVVLPRVGDFYSASVPVTLSGDGDVKVVATDPDGRVAAEDVVELAVVAPPVLTGLSFINGYPGTQTELKENDTFDVVVTADRSFDAVEVQDFEADQFELIPVTPGLNATVAVNIADRGNASVARPARVRVRDTVTGAFSQLRRTDQGGGTTDGVNLVNVNNIHPTINIGASTYPGIQQALKGAEAATVVNTISDFDTVVYDDPTASELSITSPAAFENPKTVTRSGGTYNVTTPNFRITANRAANDATSVDQTVVQIADTPATFTVSEPATRLRSGGNDGTSEQTHVITVTADQNLLSAPSVDEDSGGGRGTRGVFQGGGFAGSGTTWTRTLGVHDDDGKGVFTWQSPSATNLAGVVTNVISGDTSYTLGGFVARNFTFAAFATTVSMDVEGVDFAKLTAALFTSTNQTPLKQTIGTLPPVTDGYTIDSLGVKPTTLEWLDSTAAGANSGGTAQIQGVEETV
jgi:hypothetical protein